MMYREKVIRGLECCATNRLRREDCEAINCTYLDLEGNECIHQLIRDALALLKAQEPMKPVPAIKDVGDWLCGNCYQSVVGEEELDASGFVPVKFNFCPNCGRAVKWE